MIACIGLVIGFRSSSRLAAAYGVAVTTDMVFTSILFAVVARTRWRWSLPAVLALTTAFLVVDVSFWAGSLLKIPSGGWFPLVVAAAVFTIMTTWSSGRAILAERLAEGSMSFEHFLASIEKDPPIRVPGTAVYLVRTAAVVPFALLHNLKHNKVLHERTLFLTFVTRDIPYVKDDERVTIKDEGGGLFMVKAAYGFNETPDVKAVLSDISRL